MDTTLFYVTEGHPHMQLWKDAVRVWKDKGINCDILDAKDANSGITHLKILHQKLNHIERKGVAVFVDGSYLPPRNFPLLFHPNTHFSCADVYHVRGDPVAVGSFSLHFISCTSELNTFINKSPASLKDILKAFIDFQEYSLRIMEIPGSYMGNPDSVNESDVTFRCSDLHPEYVDQMRKLYNVIPLPPTNILETEEAIQRIIFKKDGCPIPLEEVLQLPKMTLTVTYDDDAYFSGITALLEQDLSMTKGLYLSSFVAQPGALLILHKGMTQIAAPISMETRLVDLDVFVLTHRRKRVTDSLTVCIRNDDWNADLLHAYSTCQPEDINTLIDELGSTRRYRKTVDRYCD